VKRLIGLPGDRIDLNGGVVYLNGEPVPRQELSSEPVDSGYGFVRNVQRFMETLPEGERYVTYDYGPDGEKDDAIGFVVPEGRYFFMGDNRDNSQDSRWPQAEGVGYVPAENLVGRAEIILLSWNKNASIFKPWTWVLDARPSRFFHRLR